MLNSNTENSGSDKDIKLSRDCPAILIPHGIPITMVKGESISIMQQLGGSFTVYYNGNLARIDGKDADAIGRLVPPDAGVTSDIVKKDSKNNVATAIADEDEVWAQLRTCYDPEIPVNIVDLGLIYDCEIFPIEPGNVKAGSRVEIKMTLTAPGCGMGPYIVEDVNRKVLQVANVFEAKVELIWDPPWSQDMMSEEAQLTLGLL
jgi:probable FeS assembly SUF system protein SufT